MKSLRRVVQVAAVLAAVVTAIANSAGVASAYGVTGPPHGKRYSTDYGVTGPPHGK
jgi:hypothetical protein